MILLDLALKNGFYEKNRYYIRQELSYDNKIINLFLQLINVLRYSPT